VALYGAPAHVNASQVGFAFVVTWSFASTHTSGEEFIMKVPSTILCASVIALLSCSVCSAAEIGKGDAEEVSKDGEPVLLCTKCGEIKGTDKCCKAEGRKKCGGCGLFKGSPGCCKLPKGAESAQLCTKCGEIKGTDKCCKAEGRKKCGGCGLFKGSPGCCKLPGAKTK